MPTVSRTALAALMLGLASLAHALPEIPLELPANPLDHDHAGTPAWERFLKTNPASTILDWDRFHPAPHRVFLQDVVLPGGPIREEADLQQRLRSFIDTHKGLLPGTELEWLYGGQHEKLWYARFRQLHQGLPVFGSECEFRVSPAGALLMLGWDAGVLDENRDNAFDAAAALARARTWILAEHPDAEITAGESQWLPAWRDGQWSHQPVLELEVQPIDPEHNWRLWVAADGSAQGCYDQVRHVTLNGQVEVLAQPVQQNDAAIPMAGAHVNLDVDGSSVITDPNGDFSVEVGGSGPWWISGEFNGPYANVNRMDGSDAFFAWQLAGDGTVTMGEDAHIAERDAFVHTNIVHGFITGIDPGFTGQNQPMPVNVNLNQTCNAFYNPGNNSINFFSAGGGCPNTGQVAGVLYHEYGHGINHRQYVQAGVASGMGNGAMHEGLADVTAVLLQDVDYVSPGWTLRALDNNRHYPEDIVNEVHYDGEIIGGAMWDLRLAIGLDPVRHLHHFARWGTPDDVDTGRAFFEYFVEMLLADDDNGDLGDQTPNWQAIDDSFNAHGIGSVLTWSISAFTLRQPPLAIPVDTAMEMVAYGDIPAFLADGEVMLNWRVQGGSWDSTVMTSPDDAVYTASLPAFAACPWVEVYASLVNGDDSVLFSPAGGADAPWHFAVTDGIPPLVDFETDDGRFAAVAGEWEWGTPTSGPFNAFSGQNVWATNLTGNYDDDEWSVLELPPMVSTREGFAGLGLMHWLEGDNSGDGGNLQVSRNGGPWITSAPRQGYDFTFSTNLPLAGEPALSGGESGWQPLVFELGTDLTEGEHFAFRFNFVSNASQTGAGWYLDDLALLGLAPLPVLVHDPLPDTEDTGMASFPVWLEVYSQLDLLNRQVEYRVDGGPTTLLELAPLPDLPYWTAEIPGPFSEQVVEYRFLLDFEYGVSLTLPEQGWYDFRVGVDQQPPEAAFVDLPRNLIGLSGWQDLLVQARDNLGLAEVAAEMRAAGGDWQQVGLLELVGGPDALWHLSVPVSGEQAGDHELRLRATDQSQAGLVAYSEPAVFTLGEEEAVDDFETPADFDRWEMTGEWAIQDARTYASSGWALGSSADGFYDAFSAGTATLDRSFDLSQAESAWLELREQVFMQSGLDFVYIEISGDDGPWETLASRTGVQAPWNVASLDLEPWLGMQNVRLRWRMAADESDQGVHVGYFADNIRLSATPVTGIGAQPVRPLTAQLSEAWPNPFNPSTRITLELATEGRVGLAVYNVLGQQVLGLVNGVLTAGTHEFVIDGNGLASGVYLVRASGSGWQDARRILLMK